MTEQIIIKALGQLALLHTDLDQNKTRDILRTVLDDYEITPKSRALAINSNASHYLNMYLVTRKLDGLSEKTLKNYKIQLEIFISWVPLNVEDITTMDIRKFLASYALERNIKRSTLNTYQSVLKAFFMWLEREDYIKKSPAAKLNEMKCEKRTRKSLNEEQLERLRVDGCKTIRERAILEMLFSTGARVSELCQMNINQINFSENSISVIGKGDKERTVYFSDKAKLHLKRYIKTRKNIQSPALFISEISPYERIGSRTVQTLIRSIGERAGLEVNIFPHLMRHTMATLGYKSGIELPIIQELLGHSSPNTTQTYASLDRTTVKEAHRKHMSI